ncbi:MAG: hypothetical protein QF384_01845 [Alphaproteobacteria bacterium]|nr:hypothetical protein [Alphaproteobacteria bacterium]MDP6831438.1 hypothetical protein [Alphaproteobacteria bacterium]
MTPFLEFYEIPTVISLFFQIQYLIWPQPGYYQCTTAREISDNNGSVIAAVPARNIAVTRAGSILRGRPGPWAFGPVSLQERQTLRRAQPFPLAGAGMFALFQDDAAKLPALACRYQCHRDIRTFVAIAFAPGRSIGDRNAGPPKDLDAAGNGRLGVDLTSALA